MKIDATPVTPPRPPTLDRRRSSRTAPLGPTRIDVLEIEPGSRFRRYRLHSSILPDDREITLYLPEAYLAEPGRRFPVFYLHDGQNLFDDQTAYIPGHTWRAHTTADQLTQSGQIEPVILVGIANTGLRRMAEYTPTVDAHSGGGEGPAYGRLLVEEVKPFVDRTFLTQSEASQTGLGGSSLGGLISLYLGLRDPQVFGRLAVVSPSIWWDRRSILDTVAGLESKPELRIWLDIGTAEGARHVADTDRLYRLLIRLGWRDDLDLRYRKFPGAVHTEDAWAARFDQILRFLFPAGT